MIKHTTILKTLEGMANPVERLAYAKKERSEVFNRIISASGKRYKLLDGYFKTFTKIMEDAEKEIAAQ